MTDQYLDQYKKETAQVHAPMDLIERTKAAVREEEKRLLRERAIQEKISEPVNCAKSFSIRKWAYPLTAAAALLILVSVSLSMKGMKGNSSGMSGASYEGSAEADAGSAESAALDSMAEEGAFLDMTVETEEEEMAVESAAEDLLTEAATGSTETAGYVEEDATSIINEAQHSMEQKKQAASAVDDMAQDIEEAEAVKEDFRQKQEAAESLADSTVADDIVVEKVTKKPAFCDLSDTKAHVYEGKTFLVRKEKNGWLAYVEVEKGTGYVLHGEAESLAAFLEAGYGKLADIW